MTTTTTINTEIKELTKFKPDSYGAYPTCRCLLGQYDQENQQEWAHRGTIDGSPAKVYYMFDKSEVEDGADMPFDSDHVIRIEIAEKNEDGEYETL